MLGRNKRKIEDVTFVQPLEGEAYFNTPIAYSSQMRGDDGRQVFKDSDLALAGKLKLIFEREQMVWFEIREEKSPRSSKEDRVFVMYYFPHRLVASRVTLYDEKATLQDIKKLFDFIVTEAQTRPAKVQLSQMPSAYPSILEALEETSAAKESTESDEHTETIELQQ